MRNRGQMVKEGGLPDEMVAEILSRLPFKSLTRLKRVSKSWYSLTRKSSLSKLISSDIHGFFCQVAWREGGNFQFHKFHRWPGLQHPNVDTKLNFLGLLSLPEIVDSCSGLLLCRELRIGVYDYYVCNPTTKRYEPLPFESYCYRDIIRITFQPHVSSHYNAIFVKHCHTHSEVYIFSSSERSEGWQKLMSLQSTIDLDANGRCSSVFSNGAIYLTSCGPNNPHIVRLRLLQRTHNTIILPTGYAATPFIGILAGSVCCAKLVGRWLWIWTLVEHDDDDATTSWVLKHNNIVTQLEFASVTITAFHPFLEVVFFQMAQGFRCYNLKERDKTTLDNVRVDVEIPAGTVALLYTPCYVGALDHKGQTRTSRIAKISLMITFAPMLVLLVAVGVCCW